MRAWETAREGKCEHMTAGGRPKTYQSQTNVNKRPCAGHVRNFAVGCAWGCGWGKVDNYSAGNMRNLGPA
eukprot:8127399-Lingulodinium_polyedra.AAC.1